MVGKLTVAILSVLALATLLEISNASFVDATFTIDNGFTQIAIRSPVSDKSYNESSVKLIVDVRMIYGTSSTIDEFRIENLTCSFRVDAGGWNNFGSLNIISNTASPDVNFWNGFLHKLNITCNAELTNLTDGYHTLGILLETNDSWGNYQDTAQANFTTNALTNPAHSILPAGKFTPSNTYPISSLDSAINFAYNGSYNSAKLENNFWSFNGLVLGGLGSSNIPSLDVSAQDCNVTITHVDTLSWIDQVGWLTYGVEGAGNQTFNMHWRAEGFPIGFKVYIDGVVRDKGHGWTVWAGENPVTDNMLTVTGAKYNVSIGYAANPQTIGSEPNFTQSTPNAMSTFTLCPIDTSTPSPSPSPTPAQQPTAEPSQIPSSTSLSAGHSLFSSTVFPIAVVVIIVIAVSVYMIFKKERPNKKANLMP